MIKIKNITAVILAGLLMITSAGCGSDTAAAGSAGSTTGTGPSPSEAASGVKEEIANREDFGTVYVMTAVFAMPEPEIENNSVASTSDFVYADITDCGELNSVNKKFAMPELSGDKEIEYFSPIITKAELKSITYREPISGGNDDNEDKSHYVTETIVKAGDKEFKGFVLNHSGIYDVSLGEEVLTLSVKEGSLYLDNINEIITPNTIVNTQSDDFNDRCREYDVSVPALVKGYLEKFKDEAQTLAALKMDNAVFLKEYNRLRKLQGKSVLSAEDMVKEHKNYKLNEKDLNSVSNRRGLKEKIAILWKTDFNSEANAIANNTAGNNTNKNNNNTNKNNNNNNTNNNNTANSGQVYSGGGSGAEAMALINDFRAQHGLPPFSWYGEGVASIRASEIASNFSHSSASGQDSYGENIAMANTGSASYAVNMWINSPGHRANLLDPVCTKGAVAVVRNGGWYYWSMNIWR